MMNLHLSFKCGYGEDFLSNCCFKKRCVDLAPPPGANRVNKTEKKQKKNLLSILPPPPDANRVNK